MAYSPARRDSGSTANYYPRLMLWAVLALAVLVGPLHVLPEPPQAAAGGTQVSVVTVDNGMGSRLQGR